ncbi:MAG: hypothetical protein HUU29_12575 [Planctomycetaceae bacterium]|nr:hypothetical protein [Planctomycetaceae bacterium]
MWSRYSRRQQTIRFYAGIVGVGGVLVAPWFVENIYPPTIAERVSACASEIISVRDERVFVIDANEAKHIDRLDGSAVYSMENDGSGIIIGRVERDGDGWSVLIAPAYADRFSGGAVLRYAKPTKYLSDSLDLLCAPEGVEAEFAAIQRDLAPLMGDEVLLSVESRLSDELRNLLNELPTSEKERVQTIVDEIAKALEPETEMLVNRLVNRAWQEIGVWGVTVGLARKAGEAAEDAYKAAKDAISKLLGGEGEKGKSDAVDFLSDDLKKKLAEGMRQELSDFWKDQGENILAKSGRVLQGHETAFVERFKKEWLPRLYERVLVGVWEEKQDVIKGALSKAGVRFAYRRLLTDQGSLRLPLAYTLRSVASITSRPLLVMEPRVGEPQGRLRLVPYVGAGSS